MSKKILYVEDNKDTAKATQIILAKAGFDIDVVFCGKDALDKANKEKIDLFLLDVMLPDMSGWDIFEKLKGQLKKGVKFIFLSAIPVSTDRMKELKSQGVSDYITKPFKAPDLIVRVKTILE